MEDENTTAGTPECADVDQDTGKDSVHKDDPNPNNTLGENAMLDDMLNSPIPIKILKNASFPTPSSPDAKNMETPSPRTPVKTADNPGLHDVSASPNGRKFKILYENMRDHFNEMTKKCEDQKKKYDHIVAEKDKTIIELSAMLQNERTGEIKDDAPKVMKMNNKDIFVHGAL